MRIKLIANPISGGDSRPGLKVAEAELKALGAEVDVFLTSAPGDARTASAQARAENFDLIVAAGGDGTLNEVVNGVAGTGLPIAFLPLGTVNVFALEAGIPFDVKAACEVAVKGRLHNMTLGRINGELFLLMASSGWDAEAVAGVRAGVKRAVGRLAYGLSALEAFVMRTPAEICLELPDGHQYSCYGAVVSNCRYYGGRYVVTPKASMLKKQLDVCLLKQGGRLALLKFALSLALGRSLGPPFVEFLEIEKAELLGNQVAVQVDGDAWGQLPVKLEAVPEAVTMVLPAGYRG